MGQFYLARNDGEMRITIDMSLLAPQFTTALGYCFEKGSKEITQDYLMALKCYEEAAERGDAVAVNNLGWMYLNGYAVPQNEQIAIGYFYRAATEGSDCAMVNLGNIHEKKKEFYAALYWYQKAAKLGNVKGIFNCANMLHWGWGIKQNYHEAYQIFKRLFDLEYFDGTCFYLGYYAEHGLVVPTDHALAMQYYRKGVKLDDMYCCTNLGRMYALGIGCPVDKASAVALYRRAGELGDALGYTNLAWMYENGEFVSKDMLKALEFYQLAANMGEENAVQALERINSETNANGK